MPFHDGDTDLSPSDLSVKAGHPQPHPLTDSCLLANPARDRLGKAPAMISAGLVQLTFRCLDPVWLAFVQRTKGVFRLVV
jgi:hypothetical protein